VLTYLNGVGVGCPAIYEVASTARASSRVSFRVPSRRRNRKRRVNGRFSLPRSVLASASSILGALAKFALDVHLFPVVVQHLLDVPTAGDIRLSPEH
jgi:hypothetical protein